jgi:hypothetical protein
MNDPNCNTNNCDVNSYSTYVSCIGDGKLYNASDVPRLIIENSCEWLNGIGGAPLSTYTPIVLQGVNQNHKFLVDGELIVMTNNTYNGLPCSKWGKF